MEQNKTGKYFKYAIGEIVLVVIGILIALSINNWNEKKAQQRIVKAYLSSFVEDLKNDISEYERKREGFIFRFNSLQYLLTLAGEKPVRNNEEATVVPPLDQTNRLWNKPVPTDYNKEFVEKAFLQSIRGINTVINTTTVDELKSTGTFSLISNEELKDAINNYYSEIKWRFGQGNLDYNIYLRNSWQESFMKLGILVQDMTNVDDPISFLKNQPESIGLLRAVIRTNWFKYENVITLKEMANELIELIESEISK